MTTEQIEEQKRGETGGIAQENVHATTAGAANPVSKQPKIAINFKTKKVKSSVTTLAARKCDNLQQQPAAMVSKAKQQQINNIGKWNEKKAERKEEESQHAGATTTAAAVSKAQQPPPQKKPATGALKKAIRTTPKGEPICMICKKKFPTLAKLRLHEKGSDLHKKNLLRALQEKKLKAKLAATIAAATAAEQKRDSEESIKIITAQTVTPVYTDRAEKRRQLHGADLCAPGAQSLLQLSQTKPQNPEPFDAGMPRIDPLDENNVGHKMLQKMGYDQVQHQHQQKEKNPAGTSSNENLRKEWDRIEAMVQKSVPRSRYS